MKWLKKSSFARTSGLYFAGSLVNGLAFLVFIPIFTRYLNPTDYGIVATATVLTNIFVIAQGLNAYGLVARTFFDKDSNRLASLVSTASWSALAISLVLCLVVGFGGGWFAQWTGFPAAWLPAVVVLAFCGVIQSNYQALLQARQEPWRYVLNQTTGTVLALGLSLWLVVDLGWNWQGRLLGMLLGAGGVCVICIFGLSSRLKLLRFTWSPTAMRELLHFGIPLIPHVLGGWVMTMSARLYLNNMASVADTGLFSLAFNLVTPVTMLVGALNNTYYPWLFGKLSNPDSMNPLQLCRGLLMIAFLLVIAGFCFGFIAIQALPYIAGPEFQAAGPYILWLSLTAAVSGVYFIFGNFVVYSKRTTLMTWRADFLGGLFVLVFCPLLILWIGPIGAAVASCLGYVVTTIGCFHAARIAHPMPWGAAFLSLLGRQRSI
jgi:O-antigen/teichoic acid export membrane protein